MFSISFFITSFLLGVGLAMDAFSVSVANGLHEPNMRKKKQLAVTGTFAFFQFMMPMIGWFFVHMIVEAFTAFQKFIPWIALILLCYIGGKMLVEGIQTWNETDNDVPRLRKRDLLIQGIATSIDALSVGFTISEYGVLESLVAALIIGAVTLIICIFGLSIGKKVGEKIGGKANVLGGLILIGIGIEIFVKGVFL